MKKLLLFLLFITLTFTVMGTYLFTPEEPASDKKIKEVLETVYSKAEEFEINQYLKAIKLVENNRPTILKLKKDGSYEENPQLPIDLVDELSKVFHGENPLLRVDENGVISFIKQKTDYKSYLYVIKSIAKIDTVKNLEKFKYQKSIVLEDKYLYSITIKDAFFDIDPNNFAPN